MKDIFIIIIFILIFLILFHYTYKIEKFENPQHNNTFWTFWNTPNYIRMRCYPYWDNIYWGKSYWPGGKNIYKNYI